MMSGDSEHVRKIIDTFMPQFLEAVEPSDLLPLLLARNVISYNDADKTRYQATRRDRMVTLLDILRRKSNLTSVKILIETLREGAYYDLSDQVESYLLSEDGIDAMGTREPYRSLITDETSLDMFYPILGRGIFEVYPGTYKKRSISLEVAVKIFPKADFGDAEKNEIELLKAMSCPNVVGFIDTLEDVKNKAIYFVMERVDESSIDRFCTPDAPIGHPLRKKIALGVWSGLEYIHSPSRGPHGHGIMHRDIKPENVLASNDGNIVKLADFGMSEFRSRATERVGSSRRAAALAGTRTYTSPEGCRRLWTLKNDVWAAGLALAFLFSGHYLFDDEEGRAPMDHTEMAELLGEIRKKERTIQSYNNWSKIPDPFVGVTELALRLYDDDPPRPSASEMKLETHNIVL